MRAGELEVIDLRSIREKLKIEDILQQKKEIEIESDRDGILSVRSSPQKSKLKQSSLMFMS